MKLRFAVLLLAASSIQVAAGPVHDDQDIYVSEEHSPPQPNLRSASVGAHADPISSDKAGKVPSLFMHGGDISLRSDAENTETAQLLQLVKDLAGQVEDLKAELLVQKDYVKSISTTSLNIDNITELDAEIARVAEEVFESHVPPQPEPPQDDPSAGGHPDAGGLKLSEKTGLWPGSGCLRSHIDMAYGKSGMPSSWKHLEHSAYYWTAWDSEINWSEGCDKCPFNHYVRDIFSPFYSGVDAWFKCEGCYDLGYWKSMGLFTYGTTCDWYSWSSNHCTEFGYDQNYEGITANEACCACGGGYPSSEEDGTIKTDLTS